MSSSITTARTPTASYRRLRAMGTDVHLCVVGDPGGVLDQIERRVIELEARWSRFIDSSEVTAINLGAGSPVSVSADTMLLVRRALSASRRTGGWFDPTMLNELVQAGYDRTFTDLESNGLGDLVITIDHAADGNQVRVLDWNAVSRAITIDTAAGTVMVAAAIVLSVSRRARTAV